MIPVQRPFLGREELEAVSNVFDTRWLGMGSVTKDFEDKLREFLGVRHVVAVNSGTSALHIALDAVGVGEGDEVIVPSLTFVASSQVITACGARPVFCDVNIDTLNMDPSDAAARITSKTRAIMPVHFGGLACEMNEILAMASEHGLSVIEDAAHAFGSSYDGRKIGTLSDICCFSFDPIKNITCGEGGAVVTESEEIAERVLLKRILGIDQDTWSRYRGERSWVYDVVTQGYRYHMSNINAAIGLEQLKRFEEFKARKQEIVTRYDRAFENVSGLVRIKRNPADTFPFFYVIRVLDNRRDDLMKYLKEHDIGSGVHYIPNHLQSLYAELSAPLPICEQLYREMITLPLYFEMTDADVDKVTAEVESFLSA